jgi:hypothetical protein
MQEQHVIDTQTPAEDSANRRRHPRSIFTYPVEFKLFLQKTEGISFVGQFVGYLMDISLGGAGLKIEDPYGRVDINGIVNGRVRLTLSVPRENKINIFAHVQWITKTEGTPRVKLGISFKDLDYKDLTVIEKLIGLKSKDHNMMWNLWEQYMNDGSTHG